MHPMKKYVAVLKDVFNFSWGYSVIEPCLAQADVIVELQVVPREGRMVHRARECGQVIR